MKTELCLHVGAGIDDFIAETWHPTAKQAEQYRAAYRPNFRWCRQREGTPKLEWLRVVTPFLDRADVASRGRLCPYGSGSLVPISEAEAAELIAAQTALDDKRAAVRAAGRFFFEIARGAREAYRASLRMVVLSVNHGTPGEFGRDPLARVRVVDPQTDEQVEFDLCNVFDGGFVVKQARGEEGTPFALRAQRYVREFSPIATHVRM